MVADSGTSRLDEIFDDKLLEGYRKIQAIPGIISSHPETAESRVIPGSLGVVISWNADHFAKKRPDSLEAQEDISVVAAFDRTKFHFNKANPQEVLFEETVETSFGDFLTPVLINISPLATGHVVVPIDGVGELPQVLTEALVLASLTLLTRSRRPDFRLVFNSRGAFASVNHFHVHGLYLNYCGLEHLDNTFPLEAAVRVDRASGRVRFQTVKFPHFYICALCFSCPLSEVSFLVADVWRVVKELQRKNTPHNVIFRSVFNQSGGRRGFEVIVVPRKQQRFHDTRAAGFTAAVMEVAGCLYAKRQECFDMLTEERLVQQFRSCVSISPDDLEGLATFVTSGRASEVLGEPKTP